MHPTWYQVTDTHKMEAGIKSINCLMLEHEFIFHAVMQSLHVLFLVEK